MIGFEKWLYQSRKRMIRVFLVVGFLVFLPSLGNEFVWDDEAFIVNNRNVVGFDVWGLLSQGTEVGQVESSNYYRPITSLSLALDKAVWGLWAPGFRLMSVFYHLGAGVVLFRVMEILYAMVGFKKDGVKKAAFWTVLIFLVHPVQTRPVIYLSARGDSLHALFLFLGLLSFLKSIELGKEGKKLKGGWGEDGYLCFSVVCYGLSVLAKEFGVAGVGMVGLVWGGLVMRAQNIRIGAKKYAKQFWGLLGMVGFLAIYLVVRVVWLNLESVLNFSGQEDAYAQSLGVRVMTTGEMFWTYLKVLVWPYPLYMLRNVRVYEDLNVWFLAMVGLLGLAFWVGYLDWKRNKSVGIWLGWGWFLVMMVPISGVIPLNDKLYEHWVYVPMVGLVFVVMVGLWRVRKKVPKLLRDYGEVVGWGLVATYAGLTIRQASFWKNGMILYGYNLQYSQDERLYNNLGLEYVKLEDWEMAEEQFELAVEQGESVWAVLNLARVNELQGDWEEALEYYKRANEMGGEEWVGEKVKELSGLQKDSQRIE